MTQAGVCPTVVGPAALALGSGTDSAVTARLTGALKGVWQVATWGGPGENTC